MKAAASRLCGGTRLTPTGLADNARRAMNGEI
jgi:hypothetical protein